MTMRMLRRNWVLIAPIAFLVLFVILPFGFVIAYSFWTLHPVTGLMVPAVSLENYARFFQSTLYVRVLWNTFEIAGTATVFALLICYPLAYWLGRVVPLRSRPSSARHSTGPTARPSPASSW